MKFRMTCAWQRGAVLAVVVGLLISGSLVKDAAAQTATDLTCSACVQSSDLANNAAGNSKIANGAVSAAKLATNAVTVAKIADGAITQGKLTTAAVTTGKIGPNAVTTGKIANAAVTAAKIGPDAVDESKFADSAVATAKIADGAVTNAKLAPDAVFKRTVLVSVVGDGSDTAANGQALLDALADVAAAVPAPGVDNPWLIKLGQGVFNVGTNPLVMLPYVDLEGSGQASTRIEGDVSTQNGMIRMASNMELRRLTAINSGSSGRQNAVVVNVGLNDTFDWRISDVTAMGSGGTTSSAGIQIRGGDCGGGVMNNIIAEADGPAIARGIAISCSANSLTGTNLTAMGTGGTESTGIQKSNAGGTALVRNSSFTGTDTAINLVSGTLKVISSELDGPVSNSGTLKCVGAYNASGFLQDSDCTPLP